MAEKEHQQQQQQQGGEGYHEAHAVTFDNVSDLSRLVPADGSVGSDGNRVPVPTPQPPLELQQQQQHRTVTPVRVRPHSQPRARPAVLPITLAAPQRVRVQRVLGRRKERRDKARLVKDRDEATNGVTAASTLNALALAEAAVAGGAFRQGDLELLAANMQFESRSGFERLLRADDELSRELRDEFVGCKGSFAEAHRLMQAHHGAGQRKHVPTGQLSVASDRFLRVDRKLRHEMVTTGTRPRFTRFIAALEEFLMVAFEFSSDIAVDTAIAADDDGSGDEDVSGWVDAAHEAKRNAALPVCLEELAFALDPSWDTTSATVQTVHSRSSSSRHMSNGSKHKRNGKHKRPGSGLKLCFRSGVFRVLAHGVCEFHGLHSSSADGAHGKRVTTIVHPGAPQARMSVYDSASSRRVVSPSLARFLVDNHARAPMQA